MLDGDIAEATPTPRIEPVEVGQELGPLGGDDQAGRPMAPVAPPIPHMQPIPHIEPEQPKRRSTVREPAPSFTSGRGFTPPQEPTPPAHEPPPASAEDSSGDEGKPRKTGWWAKRMFGEKG